MSQNDRWSTNCKGQIDLKIDKSASTMIDIEGVSRYLVKRGFAIINNRTIKYKNPTYALRVTSDTSSVHTHDDKSMYAAVGVVYLRAHEFSVYTTKHLITIRMEGTKLRMDDAQSRRCARIIVDYFSTATPAPSILVVDNSKDLSVAKMTPRLIRHVQNKTPLNCIVVSTRHSLQRAFMRSNVVGIVLSGGPLLLSEKTDLRLYNKNITALLMGERMKIPVMGICFGMQIMAASYGGSVRHMSRRVHGRNTVYVVNRSRLLGSSPKLSVFCSHQNHVTIPPCGFRVTSVDEAGRIQSIENDQFHLYGVQFHPEGTLEGCNILDSFVQICKKIVAQK